jgi:transposase
MHNRAGVERIEAKYRLLSPLMDERMRRQWAAAESRAYGWGGVETVSVAIGMSPSTIRKGLSELAARESNPHAVIDSRPRRENLKRSDFHGEWNYILMPSLK